MPKFVVESSLTSNKFVLDWVKECAELCNPDEIVWCDGSEEEKNRFTKSALACGDFIELDQEKLPGCYYHRSAVDDVARTEHLTFVCTSKEDEVGPNNNWMPPHEAYQKLSDIFRNSMIGRKMFVIPFVMGVPHSTFSKVGIQLTDSLYVVLSMRIMTRMGKIAFEQLGNSDDFTKCFHGKAELDINKRFICHFPEDNAIWSVGSGYGGNALLGKKCLSLRIASCLGKKDGWLAEHMLIMGLENPKGEIFYIAAAFPSACGKTNLAMLVPPKELNGWKVWTVGDDIAWIRIGEDGRFYATNPELGFFGVAPMTSYKTNPNAMEAIKKNSIFTNVLLKDDKTVWWEGMEAPPSHGIAWNGKDWTPESGEKGAHPNSRFTAPIIQCPSLSKHWTDSNGVPLSAILFGGRRPTTIPLAVESFSWQHGVYAGATMGSLITAAQVGKAGNVGELRRDPMAMLPFCGYHMGEYFQHWLNIGGKKAKNPPKLFFVNWFRTDENNNFLWPGFGENLRVLEWIVERCNGNGKAKKTEIGFVPTKDSLNLNGLNLSDNVVESLLSVNKIEWIEEIKAQEESLKKFGNNIPKELLQELNELKKRFEIN